MIRKRKKFSWPRKLYEKSRIEDENALVKQYGLKNKREIWRFEEKVRYFRNRAKELITATQEEQEILFGKLRAIGLSVNSIADVLALTKQDLLNRRLSSVLVQKNLANTPLQARQMIAHKRVVIDGKAISSPSYLVRVSEEGNIKVLTKVIPKPVIVKEETAEVAAE